MDTLVTYLAAILSIGIGATAIMDIWGLARKQLLGMAAPDYCLVGRWFGHMPKGTFHHPSIRAAQPVRGECVVGWIAHYLIGIGFAAVLMLISGLSWLHDPTLAPALAVGLGTLVAPFFLMQPGMGAGIASARVPKPNVARIQSGVNHLVFGFGLYLSGVIFNLVSN